MLALDDCGLYCAAGDFHIDPWKPVDRAIITHAHGDHARWGSANYLCSREGEGVLRTRLGAAANIQPADWRESIDINGVTRLPASSRTHPRLGADPGRASRRSLGAYPAITRSSRIRPVRRLSSSAVTPSSPKAPSDCPSTAGARSPRCSTTSVPGGRANRDAGRASVLFGYALGKAQRLLAGLAGSSIGPVYTHGAVERLNRDYRAAGIRLLDTQYAGYATERP